MNPCRPQEMEAVRAANVLNGTDPDCMNWIRTYKDHQPATAARRSPAPAAPVNAPAAGGSRRRTRCRGGREARMSVDG